MKAVTKVSHLRFVEEVERKVFEIDYRILFTQD